MKAIEKAYGNPFLIKVDTGEIMMANVGIVARQFIGFPGQESTPPQEVYEFVATPRYLRILAKSLNDLADESEEYGESCGLEPQEVAP